MGIREKLEEIQKQPEHIRMRYVFACVFVSMIFVFFLWLVSLKQSFQGISNSHVIEKTVQDPSLQSAVKELQQQTDSLKEETAKLPIKQESVQQGEGQ